MALDEISWQTGGKRIIGFCFVVFGTLIVLITDKGGWGGFLAGVGIVMMLEKAN